MTRVDSRQIVIHDLYPRLNYGALIFWPFLSATAIHATVASRRMHHLYSYVISNSTAGLVIYLIHLLFFTVNILVNSMIFIFTVTPHIFFPGKHHLLGSHDSSPWSFWQFIGTLVPPSPYSRVYRFYQSSPCVQFRTLVRSEESVAKKALKSKGLLALFGPVNPGGENRGPKNIWKSRYLTMSRGPRPTRQNRELKSADCHHIATIFSIGRDRLSS